MEMVVFVFCWLGMEMAVFLYCCSPPIHPLPHPRVWLGVGVGWFGVGFGLVWGWPGVGLGISLGVVGCRFGCDWVSVWDWFWVGFGLVLGLFWDWFGCGWACLIVVVLTVVSPSFCRALRNLWVQWPRRSS
jgi:hypothetical protein